MDLREEMYAAIEADIVSLRRAQELLRGTEDTLLEIAAKTLEDRASAVRWLISPLAALGGKSPVEIAHTPEGAYAIRRVLNAIEHGVYL